MILIDVQLIYPSQKSYHFEYLQKSQQSKKNHKNHSSDNRVKKINFNSKL